MIERLAPGVYLVIRPEYDDLCADSEAGWLIDHYDLCPACLAYSCRCRRPESKIRTEVNNGD